MEETIISLAHDCNLDQKNTAEDLMRHIATFPPPPETKVAKKLHTEKNELFSSDYIELAQLKRKLIFYSSIKHTYSLHLYTQFE